MNTQFGVNISIFLGGAIGYGSQLAVGVTMAHCTWTGKETEKAIKLKGTNEFSGKEYNAWLPKAALIDDTDERGFTTYKLAKWFKPKGWTATFLDLVATSSVIAA